MYICNAVNFVNITVLGKIDFININSNDGISSKYGTIDDSKHPSVILLRGKCRVMPINNKGNYSIEVISFKNAFEKIIEHYTQSSKVFCNDYFACVELSEKNVMPTRYSYVKYDIYLKPIRPRTLLQQKKSIISFSKTINDSMVSLLKKDFLIKND